MSRWAQLYWPVDKALPAGTAKLDQALFERKRSILTKFLPSTRKLEREYVALCSEWEKVIDDLNKLYGDTAPTRDGDSLGRWLSAINYRVALSGDEVRELGIAPLMTIAVWDNIEDDGKFLEDPEWWARPEAVERACEGLIELVEVNNVTAVKAREIYARGSLPDDDPRLGDENWRKEREASFIAEMGRIAQNAAKCREQGITKVGFLVYM